MLRRCTCLLWCSWICFTSGGTWARPSSADEPRVPFTLSLNAAIRTALVHGIAARSEALDQLVQRAQWETAQLEFTPKVNLSNEVTRHRVKEGQESRSSSIAVAGLNGTWKLPTGALIETSVNADRNAVQREQTGRLLTRIFQIVQPLLKGAGAGARLTLEQARVAQQIGEHGRTQALDAAFVAVSDAYFEAVLARQQVDLDQQALERVVQTKEVNRSLHEAGQLAKVELLQSDADLAQAEVALELSRNAALAAASALLQLLGPDMARRDPSDLVLPASLPSVSMPAAAEEAALQQAMAQREDLLMAQAAVAAAQLGVAQAVDEGRPALDLVLGVQSTKVSEGASSSTGTDRYIGINWIVPLDRGLLRLQRTQARLVLQQAELALEDMRMKVRSDVLNARRELSFAQRQLVLSDNTVEINRRKLAAETERSRAGKISSFQLSAAQDELRNAENLRVQATLAAHRAQVQWTQVIGALAAERQALMQATP